MSNEKTPEQLAAEVAQLQKQLEAANKKAASADKLKGQVAELTTQLKVAEATKPKNAKPVVHIDGTAYVVVGGERNANGTCSAQELAENKERCAQLVRKGSGLLRKVDIKA